MSRLILWVFLFKCVEEYFEFPQWRLCGVHPEFKTKAFFSHFSVVIVIFADYVGSCACLHFPSLSFSFFFLFFFKFYYILYWVIIVAFLFCSIPPHPHSSVTPTLLLPVLINKPLTSPQYIRYTDLWSLWGTRAFNARYFGINFVCLTASSEKSKTWFEKRK